MLIQTPISSQPGFFYSISVYCQQILIQLIKINDFKPNRITFQPYELIGIQIPMLVESMVLLNQSLFIYQGEGWKH